MRPGLPQIGGFFEPSQPVVFLQVHPCVQRFDRRFGSVKPSKASNGNFQKICQSKSMSPVDKMGAETSIHTFRGEFSLLWTIVGPGAPVANHLWKENCEISIMFILHHVKTDIVMTKNQWTIKTPGKGSWCSYSPEATKGKVSTAVVTDSWNIFTSGGVFWITLSESGIAQRPQHSDDPLHILSFLFQGSPLTEKTVEQSQPPPFTFRDFRDRYTCRQTIFQPTKHQIGLEYISLPIREFWTSPQSGSIGWLCGTVW